MITYVDVVMSRKSAVIRQHIYFLKFTKKQVKHYKEGAAHTLITWLKSTTRAVSIKELFIAI